MNPNDKKGGCDRRRFFKNAALVMAGSTLTPKLSPARDTAPGLVPLGRSCPPMPRAVVSVAGVKGSIMAAVREAVEAAGGLSEIERGQKVMIKPNMCGPAIGDKLPGRITTNPEVLRAVIRLCKERGAEVWVGDRAMFWTELAMKTTGFEKVCKEEGAIAFPWTRAEYVNFTPGKRYWSKGFRIPKPLTEADHFINVPLLKNHGAVGGTAQFTCCLKSFVGVCHPEDRRQKPPDDLHGDHFPEKIAELNLCARPSINIVDATEIMVSGGPDGLSRKNSVWASPNLVMASKDRVACDSVALAALKRYGAEAKVDLPYVTGSVWTQPQIAYAAELGLGQADPAMIDLEDLSAPLMDELRDNWR